MKYKMVRLCDIAEITMGQSPKSDFYNFDGYGMPFLQGNRTFGRRSPSFDTYTTKVTKKAQAGDIIMSVRAPVGDLNITPIDVCLGRGVCSIRAKNGNQDYLFYLLKNNVSQLSGKESGTVFGSVNKKDIAELELRVADEKNQIRIARLLSAIDNKIDINEKINHNLEEQAQAIFENEFISISAIPKDWEKARLIDLADYLNGLAMQKYRPTNNETGIPVLKIKELRQGYCDSTSDLCSPNINSKYIVHDGDVIFSWSGSLLVDFWCGGTCGLNQHLFKVTSTKFDKWLYYSWTKYYLNQFIAIAAGKATTLGHIKRDELSKALVLVPSEKDYNRIGALLQPIYASIIQNRIENRHLAKTRDALLPALISGTLDVSNIDI